MRVRTHPGEVLRCEYLEPLDLSASALADKIDVPANRISDIVRGYRDVSADTALRLAEFFDTTPEFWMNLQTAHDLSKAAIDRARKASVARLRSRIAPVISGKTEGANYKLKTGDTASQRSASAASKVLRDSGTGEFKAKVPRAAAKSYQKPKHK